MSLDTERLLETLADLRIIRNNSKVGAFVQFTSEGSEDYEFCRVRKAKRQLMRKDWDRIRRLTDQVVEAVRKAKHE